MTAGVYAIVNTATDMAYIGSSRTIETRWKAIQSCLNRDSLLPAPMRKAWKESNGQDFRCVVLEVVSPDDLSLVRAEQRWIDHYGDRVYNVDRVAKRARRAHADPWSVPADWVWREGRWRSNNPWVVFGIDGPPPEATVIIGDERRDRGRARRTTVTIDRAGGHRTTTPSGRVPPTSTLGAGRMRKTDRPSNADECARERCGHPFGQHYIAHDGVTVGCSWSMDDQRDGLHTCQCDGFLIEYTYPAKTVAR